MSLRAAPWLLAALVALGALLRLAGLGAFPEAMADEGLWTTPTKNFVRFGDWLMDGRRHYFLSPVYHWLSLVPFELFSPRLVWARAISGLAGTASIPLLYLLVRRVGGDRTFALGAAALFALDQNLVFWGRVAHIEALQLVFVLAAALGAAHRSWRGALLGGLALGLALGTKLAVGFAALVLGAYLLLDHRGGRPVVSWRGLGHAAVLGIAAAGVAGAVYGGLYLWDPERFVDAFRFELDGRHFEGLSDPWVRVGRFALDPVQAGRTVLALFRESPFLMVLAALGAGLLALRPPPGALLFGLWTLVGMGFFLAQMYQPVRYFYLVAPGLAWLAAGAVAQLRDEAAPRTGGTAPLVALGVYAAFNLAYLGMNAIANPARALPEVERWVRANLDPDAPVWAPEAVCTDLPNPAHSLYRVEPTPGRWLRELDERSIEYVISLRSEWPGERRTWLERRFEAMHRWDFGAVYRVGADRGTSPGPSRRGTETPHSGGA